MSKCAYIILLDDGVCASLNDTGMRYRGIRIQSWYIVPKSNPVSKCTHLGIDTIVRKGMRHDLFAVNMEFIGKIKRLIGINSIITTDLLVDEKP